MFCLADGCRAVSLSVNKNRVHHFSTSTISGRRKTYTYFGSSGSGSKKGGSGSKGHTQCPHCGYTMFHKDTSLGKSIISISIFPKVFSVLGNENGWSLDKFLQDSNSFTEELNENEQFCFYKKIFATIYIMWKFSFQ